MTANSVIRSNSFEVRLRTQPVRLLGSNALRDTDADGDEALLRVDDGIDVNGNGRVDFTQPGTAQYGFEKFVTKHSPLLGKDKRGDGEFKQTVDATKLAPGVHYLTVRAYRRQTQGRPPVFSDFKKVILIDRTQ